MINLYFKCKKTSRTSIQTIAYLATCNQGFIPSQYYQGNCKTWPQVMEYPTLPFLPNPKSSNTNTKIQYLHNM